MPIKNILLLAIFILAVYFRFWSYESRYGIGYDGSRDAIVAFESARQFQLPLTGSFSSVAPVTFGPWYYYYITAAIFLIPSMWAPWIAIGLASVAMVYTMYLIGKKLYGIRFGLLIALITTLSPAQISASTPLQQHALIGFLSSLSILFTILALKGYGNTPKIHTLWGFIIGIAINTHFQSLGLITLPILILILKRNFRLFLFFLFGFFISMVPILLFELNNHWFNTKNIIDYILIGQYRVWTSNRWLTFAGSFFPNFWSYVIGIPFIISFLVMASITVAISIRTITRKVSVSLFIISASFLIQIILLRYYRGEKFFGYLQFFHPYIFLYTSLFIYILFRYIKNIFISILFTIATILFIFPSTLKSISSDELNTDTTNRFAYLGRAYPNSKFATYECNIYDTDRIQALTLFLYMYKLYDEDGIKIAINNPTCKFEKGIQLANELFDISDLDKDELITSGFHINSPKEIYDGTARWWFKEQP